VVEPRALGREVPVHFVYWTADAHGMNMIVKATDRACRWLVAQGHAVRYYLFSGAESEKTGERLAVRRWKGRR